jgi:hypothetical protein
MPAPSAASLNLNSAASCPVNFGVRVSGWAAGRAGGRTQCRALTVPGISTHNWQVSTDLNSDRRNFQVRVNLKLEPGVTYG